jgi:hypothetical protein
MLQYLDHKKVERFSLEDTDQAELVCDLHS